MKKLIPFLLSSVMLVGAVGCQNAAKTSTDAPNNTSESPSPAASNAASPAASSSPSPAESSASTQATKDDAQNQIRKNQLNSDIRANEQRNNAANGGSNANRSGGALQSEVRDKLEANIPGSKLAVQAKDGAVTIVGTVPKQQDLSKIEPLAMQIKGVTKVTVKATHSPAKTKS